MLFEKCFHLLSFMVLFSCSMIPFSEQNFYPCPALLFLWVLGIFFLLIIMVRSYYLRILAFATNHLIYRIFLQHLKVLKHLFFSVDQFLLFV